MSPEGISALVLAGMAVAGVVYQMGAISTRFTESREMEEKEHKQIRKELTDACTAMRSDINGIGSRMRKVETDCARQFNNINNAIIASADSKDRHFVAGYLREEKTS